jgi:hypothetical protein
MLRFCVGLHLALGNYLLFLRWVLKEIIVFLFLLILLGGEFYPMVLLITK